MSGGGGEGAGTTMTIVVGCEGVLTRGTPMNSPVESLASIASAIRAAATLDRLKSLVKTVATTVMEPVVISSDMSLKFTPVVAARPAL